MLRRIGALGLLWNRPSDAWLGIWDLSAQERSAIFAQLEAEGEIFPVQVEGINKPLYCRTRDRATLEAAMSDASYTSRCEVIAPLDPMMWDRKLLAALFDFAYSWEIYTPAAKRKYGYYVLPLVFGEGFAGRVEAVRDEKAGALRVRHVWLEDGIKKTKTLDAAVERCMKRLAKLNGCKDVIWE